MTKTDSSDLMKRTNVEAGGGVANHKRSLKVSTAVRAGGFIQNHNRSLKGCENRKIH